MKSIRILAAALLLVACNNKLKVDEETKEEIADNGTTTVQTTVGPLMLAAPFATESVTKRSEVIGWKEGEMPIVPAGFKVNSFADSLEHPRWTYLAPNGDYFVAESNTRDSANRISLLRDTNGDGTVDTTMVFKEGLNQPFGMLVLDNWFYIANTGGLYRYKYNEGDTQLKGDGELIMKLSESGYNNHWTKNVIANEDGSKLYVSVGSASNVGEQGMEKEEGRALIFEINPDGSGKRVYASGLRNPVGMDWNPANGELWTAVNERDKLGNNLVPDYATSVKEGGWYGWPYSYYGQVPDPRWKDDPHMDMVNKAIVPDVPLGNHTASLGLIFNDASQFPEKYRNGAFIGQHGSWNRAPFSGYKVVFIPFENGKPQPVQDFMTGFIASEDEGTVHGRPVGVTLASDGSLLVNDDDAGIIWRVAAQ
ncbi:L-sorbosone dehydrogenase [Nonlabens spongiae]|uniref:L-sorbosone dehydrogenase n=1 Tax=Nonlabens spongiae TaxID=331648 RepID=A0A1W6MGV4_9FLAO|nr:sorbosone dehydrogenase family protein [Nonlabens spongiae]ARN76810.1 L-sorbosone dehydrogenase [Nonlabens spongiae]